jgi:hypothetical protein
MRESRRYSFFAVTLYSALAVIAWWYPLAVALVTTATWAFWLSVGVRGFGLDDGSTRAESIV